ncbi:MAG TPA: hypothetical protein VIN58_15075, partial [Roseateles sp.]
MAASNLAVPLMDQVTLRWFSRDLNSRGLLVTNALSDPVADALLAGHTARLQPLFDRTLQDERLYAIGLCSIEGELLQRTASFPAKLSCKEAAALADQAKPQLTLAGGPVHVGVHEVMARPAVTGPEPPLPGAPASDVSASATDQDPPQPVLVGRLVLLHDMSFIERRSQDTRRYLVGFIAGLGLVIAVITVAVAQLSWRGWVNGARALMRGEVLFSPLPSGPAAAPTGAPLAPELAPLANELRNRMRDLEDEFRRSQGLQSEWNAERLRALLNTHISGDQVIVVSNREPYIHERDADGIVVRRPASGLVTAVEPVMRACSGTWVAHGSGSA